MQVLFSWLKDYVEVEQDESKIADLLTLSGTSVESIIRKLDDNIVVGEIKEILPHPNADRLQIAKVSNGIEDLQIVCGAPNIAIGQKVPLALVVTKLENFEIKRAEIRGVESFGMMCSEIELGIGCDHSGIKILPDNYKIGEKINKYITGDSVFDIEITPNRGDCLSHLGIAREIAAVTNRQLKSPQPLKIDCQEKEEFKIEITDIDKCPQYSAILIKNIKVGQSPEWLVKRLNSLGAKSINNIVDITNYIMLDWGQPLHAFDADKINNRTIFVRPARKGELLQLLDGKTINLNENNLVIADTTKALALAGVMGGKNSEVDETTKNILIESAEFNAINVRKTSKLKGISTEASYRFERGIDSGKVLESAKYAAQKITEICGGEILQMIYEGQKPNQKLVKFESDKINSLLGASLTKTEMIEIFSKLEFVVNGSEVNVPLWRHDINIWQDLAEEIGRIYGFSKIEKKEVGKSSLIENNEYLIKEKTKDLLANCGFSESLNYVFLSQKDIAIAKLNADDLLELINPIQQENKYLRNSLIPGLLKNVAKNPSFDPILLFEIGHVFNKKEETTNLSIVASGKQAKQRIESCIDDLEKGLQIKLKTQIDKIEREELIDYKIRKPEVYFIEMNIDIITKNAKLTNKIIQENENIINYRPISKFPPAVRDLAFIVSKNINNEDIIKTIYKEVDKLLLADLFDEFVSEKIGIDQKSLAYHIYLQDMEKALSDSEVNEIISKIINILKDKFKAQLRS